MKRIFEYVYSSICKNLFLSISVFLLFITGIYIAITMAITYKDQLGKNLKTEKILGENSFYTLIETFTSVNMEDSFDENIKLLEEKERIYTIDKFYNFYKELEGNYKIVETRESLFQFNDKNLNDELTKIGNLYGCSEESGHADHNPERTEYNALKVNKNFYDVFNIKFNAGDNGLEDIQEKDMISGVFGYDYSKKFKIGDIVSINIDDTEKKIKVVGFLKKGNYCFAGGGAVTNLDNFIIMPTEDIEDAKNDRSLIIRKLDYTTIITDEYNSNKLLSELNRVSKSNGLGEFEILDYRFSIKVFNDSLIEYSYSVGVLCLLSIVFSVLSLISILVSKINTNSKIYSIHLISGASMNNIKNYIVAEVSILVIAAAGIALYFVSLGSGITVDIVLGLLLLNIILIIIISIIPVIKINKVDISELLRRNN